MVVKIENGDFNFKKSGGKNQSIMKVWKLMQNDPNISADINVSIRTIQINQITWQKQNKLYQPGEIMCEWKDKKKWRLWMEQDFVLIFLPTFIMIKQLRHLKYVCVVGFSNTNKILKRRYNSDGGLLMEDGIKTYVLQSSCRESIERRIMKNLLWNSWFTLFFSFFTLFFF